jgi:calcineurin-like phosphoesterase family protein
MSQTIYFISDLHLGHKNILDFGQRSHKDITEMHLAMVDAWNKKVRKHNDIIYVLGDVAMDVQALDWLNEMNGQKRLILGNHDTFQYPVYEKYFDKVYHFHKAYKGLVLTHIPIHPNELQYRSWKYNIHGHIHDPAKNNIGDRYFNVNVDIIGYAPISLEEMREQLPEV